MLNTTKLCSSCNTTQSLFEFSKDKSTQSGISTRCKKCGKKRTLLYKRSIAGCVSVSYSNQKVNSKQRGYSQPSYTKQELEAFLYNNESFLALYKNWVLNDYNRLLKPSIDRKNDYISYTLDNIQVMTWEENRKKGHSDTRKGINMKRNKEVQQILDGKVIMTHPSTRSAFRATGISQGNIASVCRGERKSASGYTWAFA